MKQATLMEIRGSVLPSIILLCILWQHASAALNMGNETDLIALLEFKRQIINGQDLILNTWNESQHFCQWQGVTCGSRHQRVTSLNLGGQDIFGTISPYIGNLSFLRSINFQDNSFHDELPQTIGNLFRLRRINLTNNIVSGEIPVNLSRCSDLAILDLDHNNLVGEIPTEFGSLKKLLRLMLGSNNLTGKIPSSIGNISSLRQFSVATNNMEGNIPSELGNLKNLSFFSVAINNLNGAIPLSVYNMSAITIFSAAANQLTGSLPADIGFTLPNLRQFGIGQNQFFGEIPVSFTNVSQLQLLDFPENNFSGKVPDNLGNLPNLVWLNIGLNFLGSNATQDLSFLTSLSNCTNLRILYFGDNNFGGELPSSVANLSQQIQELGFGDNYIGGIIPQGVENLANLYLLAIGNNFLSGTIPNYLGKFQNLQKLSLHGNRFNGEVPASLGNLTQLYSLSLADNQLQGNLPSSFGNIQNLKYLDMSKNNFTGVIPQEIVSISSLSIGLNLSKNSLSGSLPLQVGTLTNINALDVSENYLNSEIPSTIGNCLSLEYLFMQGNVFQGNIPSTLASLKGIRQLDLSRNNLSGKIPTYLESLPFLQYLNLSFNEFEGEVPANGIFENISAISVNGNSKLCGGIAELKLPSCTDETKKHKNNPKFKVAIVIASVALFVILMVIFIVLFWRREVKKDLSSKNSSEDKLFRVSYNDLFKATEGFAPANLIGSGSFGSVYKGKLNQQEEILVAVKVLNLEKSGASKSFVAECRALRNIRHRNLVKILTYCSSIDHKGNEFKALVYEFMANGSLDMWLHPQIPESSTTLRLIQRLNIAIDVANAIHYLHDLCEPSIIHCDLKPGNILLDDELTAHVGDFGLARLLLKSKDTIAQSQSSSLGIKGSIGYAAPEYGTGGEASKYGDVYSYGVMLLEMFIGKRPTDDMFKDGLNLHNYAKMVYPDKITNIVDPILSTRGEEETSRTTASEENEDSDDEIEVQNVNKNTASLFRGTDKTEKCIASVIKIGLACSVESPKERIHMNHVLRELHNIKAAFVADGIVTTTHNLPVSN